MKRQKGISLVAFIVFLIIISLFSSGGCDIKFSTGDDDDGNNGGGGNQSSIIRGTITSISPSRDLDGIVVEVEDEDSGLTFSGTTDADGFFEIEDEFSGSPSRLEFLDESDDQLAITNVTIFPDAEVDLGDISISNGTVDLDEDDGIFVVFEGTVTENNCSGTSGSLIVTANDDDTEVLVEVDSSTDIERDDDDLDCEDVLEGEDVEVRGELSGSNVEAEEIELQ